MNARKLRLIAEFAGRHSLTEVLRIEVVLHESVTIEPVLDVALAHDEARIVVFAWRLQRVALRLVDVVERTGAM